MSRLFTFGCSYTNYAYPMWPWHFVNNFDSIYNSGRAGAGNEYIFHSVVDALAKHRLKEGDTVVVIWSSYYRFDRFDQDYGWITHGGIFANPNNEYLRNIWSLRGAAHKTWSYMTILTELFELKNIKFCFGSLYDLVTTDFNDGSECFQSDYNRLPNNIFDLIPKHLHLKDKRDKFCKLDYITFQTNMIEKNKDEHYRVIYSDSDSETQWEVHPTIPESFKFAKDIVAPALGVEFKGDQQFTEKLHKAMLDKGVIYYPVFNDLLNSLVYTDFTNNPLQVITKKIAEQYLEMVIKYDSTVR